MKYEKFTSDNSGQEFIKRDNDDESFTIIPTDPANSDYQAYLASLEEGEPKAE